MRLRFAPSPTGHLHVGGARTAVFNWLLARASGGELVLRIEDTDRSRSTDEHTRAIVEGLRWLGVDWDSGPIFQSEGIGRHRAAAERLLREGRAYRDFSTATELRAEAERRGWHPSRVARERAFALAPGESDERAARGDAHAVRFLVPGGETVVGDLVHGPVRFGHDDVDDLVILRADRSPTYNLAVVCDDAHAEVTHVLRGDDHLSNTPKQVLLYEALGLPVPEFGHVPLILGPDGSRLAKRHGARSLAEYASDGILPRAMFNFLALLGWNPGDEREIMGCSELLEAFSVGRIGVKGAVFDADKLHWLNGRHLARTSTDELLDDVRSRLNEAVSGVESVESGLIGDGHWLATAIELHKGRARTVAELADWIVPFVLRLPRYEERAVRKHWVKDPPTVLRRLGAMRAFLGDGEWQASDLEAGIRSLAADEGVGVGKYFHPLRVALVGRLASADIFGLMLLLGRQRVLGRVRAAETWLGRAVADDGLLG